ncbi:hypothetical protein RNZ50_16700 [Paracoccaceae bacterium Fryx2]|nr:hypothetical protein [Paracoccaceae bacterium Fryx2]
MAYPTAALFPMAALVRHVRRLDLSGVTTPALVLMSEDDRVVDPSRTTAVMARWGGPLWIEWRTMGPGDDGWSHVIAGDILSPGQTAETVALILDWAAGL